MRGNTTAPMVLPGNFEVDWVSVVGIDAGLSVTVCTHYETVRIAAC